MGVCPYTIITTYFSDPVHNMRLLGELRGNLKIVLLDGQIARFRPF